MGSDTARTFPRFFSVKLVELTSFPIPSDVQSPSSDSGFIFEGLLCAGDKFAENLSR